MFSPVVDVIGNLLNLAIADKLIPSDETLEGKNVT
jgi:hypothetical protein